MLHFYKQSSRFYIAIGPIPSPLTDCQSCVNNSVLRESIKDSCREHLGWRANQLRHIWTTNRLWQVEDGIVKARRHLYAFHSCKIFRPNSNLYVWMYEFMNVCMQHWGIDTSLVDIYMCIIIQLWKNQHKKGLSLVQDNGCHTFTINQFFPNLKWMCQFIFLIKAENSFIFCLEV